jgi:hypothetical protein
LVSVSGKPLAYARAVGVFDELLCLLASAPHRVTRLDAALDVACDAAPVVGRLWRKYPREVRLTQKPVRTCMVSNTRFDGVVTGSFYGGQRGSPGVACVVYDKANEVFERQGEVIPFTARYEIRCGRTAGASLRDASSPESIFYEYASPALLRRPAGIPRWEKHEGFGWESSKLDLVPYQVLKDRVGSSAEIEAFISLADQCGPHGRDTLVRLLRQKILGRGASDVDE